MKPNPVRPKRNSDSIVTYSGLLWESDRVTLPQYEFNLFCDQEMMIEKQRHPVKFWRIHEFYPSYMLIRTPYAVPGQMPIDLPWMYAWLTLLDTESRTEGFLLANLVNTIPPKHITLGTFIRHETQAPFLARYYGLRQKVKERIETFWNACEHWSRLYQCMKALSQLLLTEPFTPVARKVDAEIRMFETTVDRFFAPLVTPETMDAFWRRWMTEVDMNERRFEPDYAKTNYAGGESPEE